MNIEVLIETFCQVDDFCQAFEAIWKNQLILDEKPRRNRPKSLTLSEQMTILICFHLSGFRNFKWYYHYLQQYHHREFPNLVSYQRFVGWIPSLTIPPCVII